GRQRARHARARSPQRDLQRDGAHLQGPVRPRPDEDSHAVGRSRRARRHARADLHSGRAQALRHGRARAPARAAPAVSVRRDDGLLRAGRAAHRPHRAGVRERHRHLLRSRQRDVRAAPGRLRRAVARPRRARL
ncbi:MAG: hypothetical protein AVDCRST_MAG67-1525, partial [uncultured Solirubrobacteraceae bacterium]